MSPVIGGKAMQRLFLRQSQIKLMDYPEDSFMVYRWFAQVPASLGYDRADSAVPKRREYLKHSHYVRKNGLVRLCRVRPVGSPLLSLWDTAEKMIFHFGAVS